MAETLRCNGRYEGDPTLLNSHTKQCAAYYKCLLERMHLELLTTDMLVSYNSISMI